MKAMALPSKGVVRFPRKPPPSLFLRYQLGKANTAKHSLFLVPIADTARTTTAIIRKRGYISLFLTQTIMQAKISVVLSGKDASKLLEGLAKDPQLRAEDDPSVLVEEHSRQSTTRCCKEKRKAPHRRTS
jgi:hypothetical protein